MCPCKRFRLFDICFAPSYIDYTAAAAAVYMCYVMRRSVFLPLKCSKDVESDKGDINMQLRCFVRRVKQWCEVLVFRSEEEKMTHLSER